jgi:hypothetical protein
MTAVKHPITPDGRYFVVSGRLGRSAILLSAKQTGTTLSAG